MPFSPLQLYTYASVPVQMANVWREDSHCHSQYLCLPCSKHRYWLIGNKINSGSPVLTFYPVLFLLTLFIFLPLKDSNLFFLIVMLRTLFKVSYTLLRNCLSLIKQEVFLTEQNLPQCYSYVSLCQLSFLFLLFCLYDLTISNLMSFSLLHSQFISLLFICVQCSYGGVGGPSPW